MLTKNPHDSSPNGPWRCWHRTIFWFSVIVYNPSADDLERGVIVDRSSKAGDCSGRAKLLLLAPLPKFNCKARCLCQWMAKMWVLDKPSSAGRTVCRRTTKWVVYSGGGTSTSLSSSTNGTSRSSCARRIQTTVTSSTALLRCLRWRQRWSTHQSTQAALL